MRRSSSDLKALSREALNGQWGLPVAAYLLIFICSIILTLVITALLSPYSVLSIVTCQIMIYIVNLFVSLLQAGNMKMHLNINRKEAFELKDLILPFTMQPEASRTARGTAIINLLQLQPEEKITAVIPINEFKKGNFLFMATKNGLVKKTPIEDYANVRKTGLAAIALREDDELIEVKFTDNKKDIILVTKFGQCIRFNETDVRVTAITNLNIITLYYPKHSFITESM